MLHLFHPALLHYSVAFVTVGGVCEIAGLLSRREPLARFGGTLLLLGLASLVPTLVMDHLHRGTARELDSLARFIEFWNFAGFAGAPRAAD